MLSTTEMRNENSKRVDMMSSLEIVSLINREDERIVPAIRAALPKIAEAVDLIVEKLQKGGRLVYVGAGTSGRLGVLDAAECIPTYSSDQVIGLIAGGESAMFRAKEGAEDSASLGAEDLRSIGFSQNDVVCGIAASGRTPYVLGAFDYAHEIGTKAVSITNNAGSVVAQKADIAIEAEVGPEVVTGSTRMKAGTCDKMILNMLSTASMIRLGKVYSNLMVDLKVSNVKLVDRAERIIMMIAETDRERAKEALEKSGDVKKSIIMIKAGVDEEVAGALLAKASGSLGEVMKALGLSESFRE